MKKFLIIVCVIGVIIFLGYIGKDMDLSNMGGNNTNTASNSNVITGKNKTSNTNQNNNTNKNTTNETNNNNNVNEAKNETKNETQNTTTTNTTNTTENSTTNNTNTTNQTTENNNQTSTVEEVTISDEDKAKELARKTYGSSDGVYFKVEQVEANGVYIISVRDMETTSALAWYTVNAKTGTVK